MTIVDPACGGEAPFDVAPSGPDRWPLLRASMVWLNPLSHIRRVGRGMQAPHRSERAVRGHQPVPQERTRTLSPYSARHHAQSWPTFSTGNRLPSPGKRVVQTEVPNCRDACSDQVGNQVVDADSLQGNQCHPVDEQSTRIDGTVKEG